MDLTINNKFDNLLLGRTDITGEIKFSGATPSNTDVATEVAKNLKSEATLVVVKKIITKFSTQSAQFKAVSYKDSASKAKFEVMTKHLKARAQKLAKEEAEKKEAELEAKQKAEEEAKAAKEAAAQVPAEEKSE